MGIELVFSAVFIATCALMGAAALILTEKLKDLFKTGAKEAKYVLSIISSAVITLSVKYLGVSATWGLLLLISGGTSLPDQPEIPKVDPPSELHWFYWVAMFLLTWFMASGLYDYVKSLLKFKK